MKLRCPRCSAEYDYREATKEQALREVLLMFPDFAPHHQLVFEYVELFDTTRPMKTLKLRRVLGEVHGFFARGEFAYRKRVYRITKDGTAEALKTVCGKTFAEPLANHNYLKKVMISVAEEEEKRRGEAREKELRRREDELRGGARREGPVKSKDDTEEARAAKLAEVRKDLPWGGGDEG